MNSQQIADFLSIEHRGNPTEVVWATTLHESRENHISFCVWADNSDIKRWVGIRGVMLAPSNFEVPDSCVHLVTENPRRDFGRVLQEFFQSKSEALISPTAVIHPTVLIGNGVSIGHHTVIEEGVSIADDVQIGNNTSVLARTVIGARTIIGSNSVLGSIGFGLEKDELGHWIRIPHIGNLEIKEDVEIGSSTVIARGTIDSTRIAAHCKIDDNVFIAHNVQIDENTVVIANSEISGSVRIGRDAWIAPAVTVLEGITIGNNSLVGIGSVVIRDLPNDVVAVGNPAKVLRAR